MLDRLRPFIFIMYQAAWLEASLVVDGELAEAISEVMSRYVSGGVVIESTSISDEESGPGKVTGPLRVSGYLPVDDQLEHSKLKLQEALWHLGMIQPLPDLEFRPVAELDWAEVWKEHFHPIQIGGKLSIIPVWMDIEDEHQFAIKLDPGMAFGTGTHPTTQLCLEVIADILDAERHEDAAAVSMIDIGCGSGILGIAAVKLGAKRVLGVDLDADAVASAVQNAQINRVNEDMQLGVGSLEEIAAGKYWISKGEIVVANILAPVIIRLLEQGLAELLAPGGRLILSGILAEQGPEIESKIKTSGLNIFQTNQMGDWIVIVAG